MKRLVLKIENYNEDSCETSRHIVGIEIDNGVFRMAPIKGGNPTKEVFAEILHYVAKETGEIGAENSINPIVSEYPYKPVVRRGSSGCVTYGIQYLEPKAFGFNATLTYWTLHVSMYDKIGDVESAIDRLEYAISLMCREDGDFCETLVRGGSSQISEVKEIILENF